MNESSFMGKKWIHSFNKKKACIFKYRPYMGFLMVYLMV